jgi:hypothetical protein
MRQFVVALAIAAVVSVGCGNAAPDAGGDGGGGGGGGGGGELPAPSTVIFGSAYDPASFNVTGKTGTIKQGTPVVAVGRIFTARATAETVVTIGSGSHNLVPRPVTVSNSPDQADLFEWDLGPDHLGPGTWVVAFTTPAGKILASGYLVVTP